MTLTDTTPEEETTQPKTEITLCYDLVIIGGGVAGLSAGLYTSRDGFKTLILEGEVVSSVDMPGGALMLTDSIENFPGFLNGEGSELVSIIREQAETFGAEIISGRVKNITFATAPGKLHQITTEENYTYDAKSIIIATGAVATQLNIPGEQKYYGKGVSTCATCDGFFFRNKTVAVIGAGDTAIEDALFLTRYAEKVYLLPRRNELKASGPEAREILQHPQVEILWESVSEEIIGDGENVAGLIYRQHGALKTLVADGVFVAIGRNPATNFLQGSPVALDEQGYILTQPDTTKVQGNLHGVYAAGDCVDKVFRQAITSAGKAVEAALETRHYLLTEHRKNKTL
jgi:thioredoxin reductase (NADPH)